MSGPQLIGPPNNRGRNSGHDEVKSMKLNGKVAVMLPPKLRPGWPCCSRWRVIHRVPCRRKGGSNQNSKCAKPPCPAFLNDSMGKETSAIFGFLTNHMSR